MSDPIEATLRFALPMPGRPVADIAYGSGSDSAGKLRTRDVSVSIADADAQQPQPTIAKQGFGAVPFTFQPPPSGDPGAQFVQQFAAATAEAVRRATGATIVHGHPVTVQVRHSRKTDHLGPLSVCHTDFTPASGTARCLNLLNSLTNGKTKRVKRFAAYNVWWLARSGPQDRPLAFCDATTHRAPDFQAADILVPNPNDPKGPPLNFGEVAMLRHADYQRWYYYPRLDTDRLLVFCGFDSDPAFPSMAAHSSFVDPTCPDDAPPRVSVECRCFAFW